ncbi:MAG: hypothetical protein AB7E72_04145 [Lysobacterales bacterium]
MSTIAFALFGALMARSISSEFEAVPLSALLAAVGGWLAVRLLHLVLVAAIPNIGSDRVAPTQAVSAAMSLLLPFALLAALAELGLGWQATQAFFASGLMCTGAAAAAACMRLGAPALRVVALSGLWALTGAGAWMQMWIALAPWLDASA